MISSATRSVGARAIAWREQRRIPADFGAVLESLRFDGPGSTVLRSLPEKAWEGILGLCDREHLTLPLFRIHEHALPIAVARRIEKDLASNEERERRVLAAFAEIDTKFLSNGIESAVLKGFTQCPDFVPDLRHRLQNDLDFLCPEGSIDRAQKALAELGYESLPDMEPFPTDHLPVMIRKTGWQWRGDFFDPDIPLSVDLHFRLWDARTEGFDAPGTEAFWSRVHLRRIGGAAYNALHRGDALGYHCLHLLRHLLRSSLRVSHVFELAWFLENRAGDRGFWREWESIHSEPLRGLEGISFGLAQRWFGCRLADAAFDAIARLPVEAARWLDEYAAAPVENLFRPNKHELWLHFALLESETRAAVLRRRLLPMQLPGAVDSVYVPEAQMDLRLKLRRAMRYAAYVAERVTHHVQALPSVVGHGLLWQSRAAGLGKGFWTFIGASSLLNLGLFVFILIYNLYLLERGFREDFLGMMNGAFTAGSVAGALPAGAILQRFGSAPALRLSIAGIALASVFRSIVSGPVPLIGLAFAGGFAFSMWVVTIVPVIAQLTTERARPRGFSLFFGISIGLGVLGGFVGGRLPHWLQLAASPKQAALLVGCALVLLALWPASRLKFPAGHVRSRPKYLFTPFVRRFLLSLAGWNFAVGAFNPFFNTFFAQHLRAGMEQIGSVFSFGQIAQVAALLAAPAVLRKFGLVNGVMATQVATGVVLAAMAVSSTPWVAGVLYAGYAAFQYMSEPGVFTLLMSRVGKEEQGGASSLNFLAAFSAQAISATLAGAAFSSFGYPVVLTAIAGVAILSALVFRALLGRFEAGCSAVE